MFYSFQKLGANWHISFHLSSRKCFAREAQEKLNDLFSLWESHTALVSPFQSSFSSQRPQLHPVLLCWRESLWNIQKAILRLWTLYHKPFTLPITIIHILLSLMSGQDTLDCDLRFTKQNRRKLLGAFLHILA